MSVQSSNTNLKLLIFYSNKDQNKHQNKKKEKKKNIKQTKQFVQYVLILALMLKL